MSAFYGSLWPKPSILYRTTLMNLKYDGKIINYPLYLISRLNHELNKPIIGNEALNLINAQ